MNVRVKFRNGIANIAINGTNTIHVLKNIIRRDFSAFTLTNLLTFNGTALDDANTLRSYNISDGCIITAQMQVYISLLLPSGILSVKLDVEDNTSIGEIKVMIGSKYDKCSPSSQRLYLSDGKSLDDEVTVGNNIDDGTNITLILCDQPKKELGGEYYSVFVMDPNYGKVLPINLHCFNTVFDLKHKLVNKFGYDMNKIRKLLFGEKTLDDDATCLLNYGVVKDSLLHLYLDVQPKETAPAMLAKEQEEMAQQELNVRQEWEEKEQERQRLLKDQGMENGITAESPVDGMYPSNVLESESIGDSTTTDTQLNTAVSIDIDSLKASSPRISPASTDGNVNTEYDIEHGVGVSTDNNIDGMSSNSRRDWFNYDWFNYKYCWSILLIGLFYIMPSFDIIVDVSGATAEWYTTTSSWGCGMALSVVAVGMVVAVLGVVMSGYGNRLRGRNNDDVTSPMGSDLADELNERMSSPSGRQRVSRSRELVSRVAETASSATNALSGAASGAASSVRSSPVVERMVSSAEGIKRSAASIASYFTGKINDVNKENIMNKFLFIPESQSKLLAKYKNIKTGFVSVVFQLYEDVNEILWKIHENGRESVTPQEIEKIFENFMAEFIKYFPDVINLGQKLSGKSHGVMLCFAIAECIDHIGTKLDKYPDHLFDKMDLDEVCLQFFIKHTFYSHMLDGGTDKVRFTTEMARKVFEKYFDIFDAILLCCKGTTANPEGNKWSVMMKQLKSHNGDIQDKDLMSLWWLAANLMSDLRALHYHVKTGQQYTLLAASIRNMLKCHENENGDVLESPIIKILISPHPQAAITSLPNRRSHPIDRIKKYAYHFHLFLAFLANVEEFEGVELNPPTRKQSTYFFRRGKLPGYTDSSPEELAALELACAILYIIPHLCAQASIESGDRYLNAGFTLPFTFKNQEDTDLCNDLIQKYGEDVLLDKLQRRRASQLDNEWNVLRRLVTFIVREYNDNQLTNVDENLFTNDVDKSNFKALSVKYGGDDEVSAKLVAIRKLILEQYEGSTLAEINELRRLAAVVVRAYDTDKLSNVDEDTFTDHRDKSSFKVLSDKYKGNDKVSAKLVAIHKQILEQYEGSTLAEINELHHLASVVTKYCQANGVSMGSFSCNMLTDDEDDDDVSELYFKHQKLRGGEEQLKIKLTQVRQEWENSALAEYLDLRHLSLKAAEKVVDANTLTSPATLRVDLFTGKDRQTFNNLLKGHGQEVLFSKMAPYLAIYQCTCDGIPPIDGVLRARPCGKEFSSNDPRQILGMELRNHGHGYTGLPFCTLCARSFDIGRGKFSPYEQIVLEQIEEDPRQNLSQEQYARLKKLRPYKAVREISVYLTTHKTTIDSNTTIDFGICNRTRIPKVNSLTLNNNNIFNSIINNNRVMLAKEHRIFSIGGRDTTKLNIEQVDEVFSDECNKSKRVLIQFGSLIAKRKESNYYNYEKVTRTIEIGETAGIKIDDHKKICKTYDLSSKHWFVKKVSDESKFKKEDMILSIDGADVSGLTKSDVHDILNGKAKSV